ncbi:hypothetical protein NDU88_003465, partial [Pleurodeles waltl]
DSLEKRNERGGRSERRTETSIFKKQPVPLTSKYFIKIPHPCTTDEDVSLQVLNIRADTSLSLGRVEDDLPLVSLASATRNFHRNEQLFSNSTKTDGIIYYELQRETPASSPLTNTLQDILLTSATHAQTHLPLLQQDCHEH